MTLTVATIEQIVRYLAKIEFLEIKLSEVQYNPPVLNSTLESQIREIDRQIGDARRLSHLESWSRTKYESIIYPLKTQMYSLIRQNHEIIGYNNTLVDAARLDYESRCSPIRTNLEIVRTNFKNYLKSVSSEVQS